MRARLENFGLNTLVVRQMVGPNDSSIDLYGEGPDLLEPLTQEGRKIRLHQLYPRARTELQSDLPVLTYSREDLPTLVSWGMPDAAFVYVNDSLPAKTTIEVWFNHQPATAMIAPVGNYFRRLGLDNFLLAPQGWASEVERLGYIETTFFEKTAAIPMQRCADAINLVYRVDGKPPPQIQSALPWLRELESLQGRQQRWRMILAGILGSTVALVYGSIALLEFRQNLFITALLRSLGAPRRFLYVRQWLENAFLANVSTLAAIAAVALFHREIYGTLGFARSALDLRQGNPYLTSEIAMILLWVNAGAVLSSFPVAFGLRKPVGKILN